MPYKLNIFWLLAQVYASVPFCTTELTFNLRKHNNLFPNDLDNFNFSHTECLHFFSYYLYRADFIKDGVVRSLVSPQHIIIECADEVYYWAPCVSIMHRVSNSLGMSSFFFLRTLGFTLAVIMLQYFTYSSFDETEDIFLSFFLH